MKKLYLSLVSLWYLITVMFLSYTSTAQTQVVEVTNPTTGRIWMDRNLGASQAATSSTDSAAYGDLYQWGRGTDGHQLRTSGTELFQSTEINAGHSNFILSLDWIYPGNDSLWQGTNGVNNPCPPGFRIPTSSEFADEMATWSPNDGSGAFNSPLKLPLSGYRDYTNGSIGANWGYYWSSTVDGVNTNVYYYNFSDTGRFAYNRGYGFSVRCIKDEAATGSIPSIGTSTVTNITATTATSGGNITTNGGDSITVSGLVWSTTSNPTVEINEGITTDGSATGEFVSNLTGLAASTTYYVRAYATNSMGTAYGNEVSFTTIFGLIPTVAYFTPTSGPIGTTVTITGTNFNSTIANNHVMFGAVQAIVTSATSTELIVTVPFGATYEPISITDLTTGLTTSSTAPFTVTFPSSGIIDFTTFGASVSFASPNNPQAIDLGDMDGDGKLDMVVANYLSNTVSIFRNISVSGDISTGSFDTKIDLPTDAGPSDIELTDLDGDGKLDLIVVNYTSSTISIFRNTNTPGLISTSLFDPVLVLITGSNPADLSIGDIDADGKSDLIVTNHTSNTFSVFKNLSVSGSLTSSSFASKYDYNTGQNPWGIACGDIDGDGKLDIAVTNYNSNSVSVYMNTSISGSIDASSFATGVEITGLATPYYIALGDIDGDGKSDLAISNNAGNVSIVRNIHISGVITSGSFSTNVDLLTGVTPRIVLFDDIDGDNKPDLVVTNYGSNSVSVFKNTATSGDFTANTFADKVDFATETAPFGLAIGDVDGDGKTDLVVTNWSSNSVSVLRNIIPEALVQPPKITSFSPNSGSVGTLVTLTGTNFNPTATNNNVWFGAVKASVSSATATELTVTVPNGATYEPISVTDLTTGLTGSTIIPFSVTYPSSRIIDVTSFATSFGYAAGANPLYPIVCDLDGDGKLDVVAINSFENSLSVYLNTSTTGIIDANTFAPRIVIATGLNPTYITFGDLDGDGKQDLVVVNNGANTVSVIRNNSTIGSMTASSFDGMIEFNTGTAPLFAEIGDLDDDGKQDIVVSNGSDNSVSVFRNTSTPGAITAGSFEAKYDYPTGLNPRSIAIDDFDGDAKLDISVVNGGGNTISILRNTSTLGTFTASSFSTEVSFSTGIDPWSHSVGDIDGDGKMDLVVTNNGAASISILKNISALGSITPSSFATKVDYSTGDNPLDIAIGDLDGDGKPDLSVSNKGNSSISVLKNISNFNSIESNSFEVKIDFSTGTSPWGVAIGDIDGDGKPDLINSNYDGNAVSVIQNTISTQATTVNLTFNVDMSQLISIGYFVPTSDTLYVTGSYANAIDVINGWDVPGTGESLVLTDGDTDMIYTGSIEIDANYGQLAYRYFKNSGFSIGDPYGTRTIVIGASDYIISPADVWVPMMLPLDFETKPYNFENFGGGVTTVIANPQSNGINTSAYVAQQIRNGGEIWAGSRLRLDGYLDFTTNTIFKIKVFSPKVGIQVVLKVENSEATISSGDFFATTTKANEWEILSFNFTGVTSAVFNNIFFVFDYGTIGDSTSNSTFLFDDVILGAKSLFAGGAGTQMDPYQIETPEHLNNVRSFLGPNNTDVYFSQIANINLGVSPWSDGEGWEPIGDNNAQFFGNFNGNGYTISGLTINRPDSNQVALFGYAIEASLNNINLADVDITGNRSVAALVARLQDSGYLSFCSTSGTVRGQLFVAGLVANAYNVCTIDYCRSNVNVQMIEGLNVHQQAGGLVARLISSYLTNSYATGNIQGIGDWFGGLVGLVTDNSSISNCYATGNVMGGEYLGGLLGEMHTGTLSNCYSVGKVTGQGKGLVGIISETAVANCYWNVETSTQSISAAGDPKTTLDMISPSTFTGWDFSSIWVINAGSTYPYFQWQGTPGTFNYAPNAIPPSNLMATPRDGFIELNWQAPSLGVPSLYNIYRDGLLLTTSTTNSYTDVALTNYTKYKYYVTADYSGVESGTSNVISTFPNTGFSGGTGSAEDPYLITNPGELYTVRLYLSSHFRQINYIDLGVYPWNYVEGWEPIGSFSNPFTGSYLGDSNTIDNLTINRPLEQPVGLFGSLTNGSRIESLNLNNVAIVGGNYVGALAGDVNRSTLIRISINGAISGIDNVGGISGGNFYNTILDKCNSTGTLTISGNWSGGITGVNYASTINSSYSNMIISSSGNSVGGIVGIHENASTISNSYVLGSVYGNEYVGGIAGWVDSSSITTSYSVGIVSGNRMAGGLIGETVNNSKISSSYWNTEISGQATSAGGEGRTNSEMKYPYTNTYLGWDFINMWAHDDGLNLNNGFPYLRMADSNLPTVVTNAPKTVTVSTAIALGNVILDGGNIVLSRGIIWSTSQNPTLESYQGIDVDEGQGIGEFIGELSGLTTGTIYYVKAYATNSMGTGYGNEISFKQESLNITVTFNIDMKQPIMGRYFLPNSDVVYLTGSFADGNGTGWDEPGTGESIVMDDTDGDSIYSAIVELPYNYGTIEYKYFKNATWANGDEVAGNRQLSVGSENITTADAWVYYVPIKTGVINATASAPVIDGVSDNLWALVQKYPIDRVQPGQSVSFTTGMPTWQACWDANNTYVLITVPDDNVYNHMEAGVDPWLADRPELYFDVNAIKVEDPPLGPSSPNTGHYQFAPDFSSMNIPPSNYTVAFTIDGNDAGYIFEYAIPHNNMYDLNGNIFSPYNGLVVGFDVTIVDLDDEGKGLNLELGRVDWSNDMIQSNFSWFDMTKSGDVTYSSQLIGNPPTIISCNHENITTNSATLVAVVNANDAFTDLVFEYGTTTEMIWTMVPNPSSINGKNNVEIVGNLSGLEPNQTYYYRLKASNASGTTYSNTLSFKTVDEGGLITISGETEVCLGQVNVEYRISGSFNSPVWTVSNGNITSGQYENTIRVNWNKVGSSGTVAVEAQMGSSIYNDGLDVSFSGTISLEEPTIHVKGSGKANILICTTPNAASYQWYKNNDEMVGETKQYYVAKNNFGAYTVVISDNLGCTALSEVEQIGNKKSLYLYPNPATSNTTLTYETEETGRTSLKVIDVYGKTVKQLEWNKTEYMLLEEIPLNDLEKGLYIIEIAVEGINKENQCFIIN